MIRTKRWHRWALISDLIAKTDNTPEENIRQAQQYLAFIYSKPLIDNVATITLVEKEKKVI